MERTLSEIEKIFKEVKRIGEKTNSYKLKTRYGVKDKYQEHFSEKIFAKADKLEGSTDEKQEALNKYIETLPSNMISPVWRLKVKWNYLFQSPSF